MHFRCLGYGDTTVQNVSHETFLLETSFVVAENIWLLLQRSFIYLDKLWDDGTIKHHLVRRPKLVSRIDPRSTIGTIRTVSVVLTRSVSVLIAVWTLDLVL